MLSRVIERVTEHPRESLFLMVMLSLIGVLLAAMYLVCAAQVRGAEARSPEFKARSMALHDCMGYRQRASQQACSGEVAGR